MNTPTEITDHLDLCNKMLCPNHLIAKDFLFEFTPGEIVTTNRAYPQNIIGMVYGYIFSPFTNSYRAVLGVNCDVEIDNIRRATNIEETAFNLFTKDLSHIEAYMTCLIS